MLAAGGAEAWECCWRSAQIVGRIIAAALNMNMLTTGSKVDILLLVRVVDGMRCQSTCYEAQKFDKFAERRVCLASKGKSWSERQEMETSRNTSTRFLPMRRRRMIIIIFLDNQYPVHD